MLEICNMEEYCATLGTEFDSRAVHLVAPEIRHQVVSTQAQDHFPGFIASSSQDCIFGARDNWKWLVKLVQCVEVHLQNAAHYHQFFHKQDENAHWMADDLDRLHKSFELFNIKGDYDDAKRLLGELEEIITALKQWEAKVNFSWEEALKVVPVHLRVQGVSEPTPIRSLADYKTKQINIREGEDLLLIDNSGSELWKVRNNQGHESMVPALICLIPGPHKDAIESAVRMRLQLLASWTNSLKRIGKRLIVFMLKVFKPDYKEEEISLMQSIRPVDKNELTRILNNIEDTLKTHWAEYDGFINLQERILSLRMILEDTPEETINQDDSAYRALVVQIEMLDKLMQRYTELWKLWEMYKVALETSRQPELMLIVDKWEQLQFVSREYFTKFWKADLPFDQIEKNISGLESVLAKLKLDASDVEDGSRGDGWEKEKTVRTQSTVNGSSPRGKQRRHLNEGVMCEEGVETMEEGVVENTMHGVEAVTTGEEEGDFGYARETKTAQTEQVSQSEVEESKTFVIHSVIDPRNDEEISLQEAIMIGIINPNQGLYVNPATRESMPIPVAMSQGSIKVEFTSTKRTKEKSSSMGIITVKTIREHVKHYVIKTATDTRSGEKLSLPEAVARGIIDEHHSRYTDKRKGRDMLIAEAVDAGLAEAEHDGNDRDQEPEVISKTYAVRAVVDRRAKKTISFEEAVNRGIIDRDSGAYKDTLTGDKMYVGDAIMRGFLKARPVEDTSSLDIDPKNQMVIDKTNKIRNKLIKPLGALEALKRAAVRK